MTALLLTKNRKAFFNHQLLEKFTAGVVLRGYEVKAIREKKVSFEGSYIQVLHNTPCIINMYIGPYSKQGKQFSEQDARRTRYLLLNAKEIEDIKRSLHEKGRTAVPLALVLSHNRVKIEFAVVKGKKDYEKKETAKIRQLDKDLAAESKLLRRSTDR